MIPAAFEYHQASSAAEAVTLLGQLGGDAKVLAGGQSLLALMKLRLVEASALIDVGRIRELAYIREDGDKLAIGALTRHHDLSRSDLVRAQCPMLTTSAAAIGDPQIRHRGTIGGSLAHADPASDLGMAVLALDAEMIAQGPGGRRTIAARDFFKGFFETALGADELLVEVRVPRTAGAPFAYQKFTIRTFDWPIVGVATTTVAGRVNVALANMGSTPVRAAATESALAGGAGPAEAAALADQGLEPPSDANADADYRRHLARVLVRRAIEEISAGPPGKR